MKKWVGFLICLVVSASMWALYNLSGSYSGILTATVVAKSNIEGHYEYSSEPVKLSARVVTDGFTLLINHLNESQKPVVVEIRADDFKQLSEENFDISASSLSKYSSLIFSEEVKLESFLSDTYAFKFASEFYKKLPVKALGLIEYRPQYTSKGDVVVKPDSILVYGDADRLSGIEYVYTQALKLKDLHNDVHGVSKIEPISGVRMSHDEVSYSIDVTRYVDVASEEKVKTLRSPSETKFDVYPSSVKVTYRCEFPIITEPAGKTMFYVDYNEFKQSLTGKCIVRHDRLPEGVIDCIIEPEVCEGIEY